MDASSVIAAYQNATGSRVTTGSGYLLNTVDGPLSIEQITRALQAFGYPGPWDEATTVSAYNSLPRAPWPAPSPQPQFNSAGRTMVVVIGGLGTNLDFAPQAFSFLTDELARHWGYNEQDFRTFNYSALGGDAPYGTSDTCRDIVALREQLASRLRGIRAQGQYKSVVLIGHSLGGVLATAAVTDDPDLWAGGSAFVRGVVTLDSPLRGVPSGAKPIEPYLNNAAGCLSVSQLEGYASYRHDLWK